MQDKNSFFIGDREFHYCGNYGIVDESKFTLHGYFRAPAKIGCVEEILQVSPLYYNAKRPHEVGSYYLWANSDNSHRASIYFSYEDNKNLLVTYKSNVLHIQKDLKNYFETFLVF